MTEEPKPAGSDEADLELEESSPGKLLRKALGEPPALKRSLLPGVQARIRQQTHGRYFNPARRAYRDPWILLLGATMLLLILGAALVTLFQAILG